MSVIELPDPVGAVADARDSVIERQRAEIVRLQRQLDELHAKADTEADSGHRDRLLLRAFMDRSDLIAWLKDARGVLVYANRNWFLQFGFDESQALGQTDFDLFPQDVATQTRASDLEVLGGHGVMRSIEHTRDRYGRVHCWQVARFPFHNDKGERFVGGLAYEATERVRQDEELRQLAVIDPLTGLLNRRGFFLLAEPELSRARRRWSASTLVVARVTALDDVRTRLGAPAGDAVLKLAALILRKVFRESDILARLDDDSFAVLAPDTGGDVEVLSRRLRATIDELASNPILKAQLDFAIGLLHCDPAQGGTLESLLAQAGDRLQAANPVPPAAGDG